MIIPAYKRCWSCGFSMTLHLFPSANPPCHKSNTADHALSTQQSFRARRSPGRNLIVKCRNHYFLTLRLSLLVLQATTRDKQQRADSPRFGRSSSKRGGGPKCSPGRDQPATSSGLAQRGATTFSRDGTGERVLRARQQRFRRARE